METHAMRAASLLLAMLVGLSLAAASPPEDGKQARTLVTFCAMGDVPYSPQDDVLLPKQIADLPKEAKFVVHVGDIKGGASACDEAVYSKVFGMLAQSPIPVFIIPGDNEWNDCTHPAEAWKYWEKHFMQFDQRWAHQFHVFRQLEREENFSFTQGGVLFIGLNIVGGRVHDPAEWKVRLKQDICWTRRNLRKFGASASSLILLGHARPNPNHDEFFKPFVKEAKQLGKPILYLHGDGHRWIHDRPFSAKNILRVQVDQGGIAPPVKITVTDHATEPFLFDRRKTLVRTAKKAG